MAVAVAWPQEPLTAAQAVATALVKNGSIEAGAEALKAAGARIADAKGARLPQVSYGESWQRSNNQVFVFGSLLTQKQFGPANFEIGSLNNPPFLNNFQSQVNVDQTLFDAGRRKARIRSAELGQELGAGEVRRTQMEVISSVLSAYYGALVAEENVRVAEEAVRSAEADLQRAESRRAAGMTTDADVLSIRVHVASMRERRIRRTFDLQVGKASLNHSMGLALDTPFTLSTPLRTADLPLLELAEIEKDAVAGRPEVQQAQLAVQIGEEQSKAARAASLPEVYFRAGFEADRQRFVNRGGANWLAAAGLRWTVFDGLSDRARVSGSQHETARSRAQARVVESGIRLEARRAALDFQSARQRIEVAEAASTLR